MLNAKITASLATAVFSAVTVMPSALVSANTQPVASEPEVSVIQAPADDLSSMFAQTADVPTKQWVMTNLRNQKKAYWDVSTRVITFVTDFETHPKLTAGWTVYWEDFGNTETAGSLTSSEQKALAVAKLDGKVGDVFDVSHYTYSYTSN